MTACLSRSLTRENWGCRSPVCTRTHADTHMQQLHMVGVFWKIVFVKWTLKEESETAIMSSRRYTAFTFNTHLKYSRTGFIVNPAPAVHWKQCSSHSSAAVGDFISLTPASLFTIRYPTAAGLISCWCRFSFKVFSRWEGAKQSRESGCIYHRGVSKTRQDDFQLFKIIFLCGWVLNSAQWMFVALSWLDQHNAVQRGISNVIFSKIHFQWVKLWWRTHTNLHSLNLAFGKEATYCGAPPSIPDSVMSSGHD